MTDHYDIRKKVELYSVVFLIILAITYGGFRAYPLIRGPQITVYSPNEGDTVASTTFEVSGKVTRVKEITIQGRQIPVDEEGHFKELLVADTPYTIIIMTAMDSYGKRITKRVQVVSK